jgi:hypothetical protein
MKFATIAGTLGTIAAGAVIVASAPATPSSAAPVPVHAARMTHQPPRWVRWAWTRDRVNGKPCVIVWAAGQNAAEICRAARWPSVSS